MAELLVKAEDYSHPDPIKDQRGAFKRGMVVDVFPDGTRAAELNNPNSRLRLPVFAWILIPDVKGERLRHLVEPISDAEGEPVRLRLWQINVDDLPPQVREKLDTEGAITVASGGDMPWDSDLPWGQFRSRVRRFDTNEAAPAVL